MPDRDAAVRDADIARTTSVLLELVREMRGQRESFDEAQKIAAKERRSERRWRILFQAMFFGVPVLLTIAYFAFLLSSAGFKFGPWRDSVAVVRVEGTIGADERAAADKIVPMLEKAFSAPEIKAVVLAIDSPGGAPVEAERISRSIAALKAKHEKPVVAVIQNIGASAAFMIALQTDEIVAANYSLVGSIGAIIAPWRLQEAVRKVGVEQQVYASGRLKAFLNPFTPVTPEADVKAQALVDEIGGRFVAEVRMLRAGRLAATADIGTGEVWSGPKALEIGLVDKLGTVDEYVRDRWNLQTYDYGPRRTGIQMLASRISDSLRALAVSISLPTLQVR